MKSLLALKSLVAFLAAVGIGSMALAANDGPPVAPMNPVTDDYFGIKVIDPYRYMENLDDPIVQDWFKKQGDYTTEQLMAIPDRAQILADIEKYVNAAPARVADCGRVAGRYFYLKTLANESLGKLYMRQGLDGQEKLIIDTDQYKGPNGEPAAINSYAPSNDGKYVAFVISQGGAEIGTLRILDVDAGKETGDAIDRVWDPGVAWLADNKSFTFTRMQKLAPDASPLELEEKSKVYIHKVGDSPDNDVPVFGYGLSSRVDVDPVDLPGMMVEPTSDYAVAVLEHGTQNEVTVYTAPVATLGQTDTPWSKLCDVDADVTDMAYQGDDIYLLTHLDADRYKLIKTSLSHPDVAHAQVVVPEGKGVLRGVVATKDAIYVPELVDGLGQIIRVPYGGTPAEMKLPFLGAAGIESANPAENGIILSMTSWTKNWKYYEYDSQADNLKLTDIQPAGPYDDLPDLVSEEVQVPSYDGTMVPLSIVHKQGITLDGTNPTIMEGYGSYGITLDPGFASSFLAWYQRGGIMCVAHVRGGGEKGEAWHLGGYKLTKPNTWRDFIACAQYLIDKKYTSPQKLGVFGASAGGILIGRALTERPDLFAAVQARVGVMNPLRCEAYPNGIPNVPEFGSVKTQEGFEDLYSMDALHHVRNGVAYPAVMLTCGMHDPRVTPWMLGKMAAALQTASSSGKPVLLRVEYENGHGMGASKQQQIELQADTFAFFLQQFGNATPTTGP
jgi:prolyl oligopeptidase